MSATLAASPSREKRDSSIRSAILPADMQTAKLRGKEGKINRRISWRRLGFLLLLISISLALGVVALAWDCSLLLRRSPEASPRWAPASEASLSKFGLPVPHVLVGPYQVLINHGYVSGYDAGIQDPRWVETRFFSVRSPRSSARPRSFSPDERIESRFQVDTESWRDTRYDRGHMAPNWGVSICYGRSAQVETFLLTNVVPQSPTSIAG
jgi:DNA/RNA endonuclease G (NUC1)